MTSFHATFLLMLGSMTVGLLWSIRMKLQDIFLELRKKK